jgi:hypothetical protein
MLKPLGPIICYETNYAQVVKEIVSVLAYGYGVCIVNVAQPLPVISFPVLGS